MLLLALLEVRDRHALRKIGDERRANVARELAREDLGTKREARRGHLVNAVERESEPGPMRLHGLRDRGGEGIGREHHVMPATTDQLFQSVAERLRLEGDVTAEHHVML